MPDEKAPSSGAFLPASLMYFCSGVPMHFLSGVDTIYRGGFSSLASKPTGSVFMGSIRKEIFSVR
jgi:hypothetical protein